MRGKQYSLIVVGTGFASSFFLLEYLRRVGPRARVLVLERGPLVSHGQLSQDRERLQKAGEQSVVNTTPAKGWVFAIGFGGGSNCWVACTPRLLPEDFRLKTLYGVGRDWPITYDDLEPYYCQAEEIMAVSGPHDGSPSPRSRPYPQPPHHFSAPDQLFKEAFPDQFFHLPTARTALPTSNRPRCCASGVCAYCPIDAKFTVLNELKHIYCDPRVCLETEAAATEVVTRNGVATGMSYRRHGELLEAGADLIVLGANAIHNPYLLLRSGLEHPVLGRYLHEQVSVSVEVLLRGLDNFQGSTSLTGHGYMLYNGLHRKKRAAALIETSNKPVLRDERGKWRQILRFKAIFEDLPDARNCVGISPTDPDRPVVSFLARSDYALAGIASLESELPRILAPLPVESFAVARQPNSTEAHILGTTVMGNNPKDSIVDADLVHHQVRNLLVLGSGVFPAASPANPTLTLSALSLRSAARLVARSPMS